MDARSLGAAADLQIDLKEKRARKKAPKTRHGCSRCKTRRIKCDEQIPSCRNCVRNGALCPGYQRELRWSQKHERLAKGPVDTDSAQPQIDDGAHAGLQTTGTAARSRKSPSNLFEDGVDGGSGASFEPFAVDEDPSWDFTFSSSRGVMADDTPHYTMEVRNGILHKGPQHFSMFQSLLGTFHTPEHLPTKLVKHWFCYICPMMSTFDSEINYNRRIAESSWSMSEPVFYTIQAMAAACLAHSQHHIRLVLPSLRLQAVAAVNQGIADARKSKGVGIAADLVFALFALGSSSSWSNFQPAISEHAWLDVAREILDLWKVELLALDFLFHSYFCQALSYWEMLEVIAGRGFVSLERTWRKPRHQPNLRQAPESTEWSSDDLVVHGPWPQDSGQSLLGTRPNSWCGISNEVIDIFGQVLNLCRIARHRAIYSTATNLGLEDIPLCDKLLAQSFQHELISMDFNAFISAEEARGFPVLTRDDNTPVSHLVQTAEAYRIASLLQLRLTFGDLPTITWKRPHVRGNPNSSHNPTTSFITDEPTVSCAGSSQRMAIDLVNILDHIPAHSGSKSIHPVLYLSAAAGLRLQPHPSTAMLSSHDLHIGMDTQEATGSIHTDDGSSIKLARADSALDNHTATLELNTDVTRARVVARRRLSALERPLAHKARNNMLRLVDTIWHEYDSSPSAAETHWLDITRKHGLNITLW